MGIGAASMLQLFTIHSSLTWSENLFGGTITWALENVEGNFPGPESTLDRLAILQECDVYVEGICHWS
jgi:hypothetical protein